jgi:hypothetical protein
MNKKGQFFIISIVLLALALFILMAYFISVDEASTVMFEASSYTDFKDIRVACEGGSSTGGCSPTWKDANFAKRKNVTINAPAIPGYMLISWAGATEAQCKDETRMYLNNDGEAIPLNYDMIGVAGGECAVIPTDAIAADQVYWLYYDNSGGAEDHTKQESQPELNSYTLGSEEAYATCNTGVAYTNMCPLLKQTYGGKFQFNCTPIGTGPYNYTILINSKDFYFSGNIIS